MDRNRSNRRSRGDRGGKKQQFSWFQTHEDLFFLPDQGRQERGFSDTDKFGSEAWKVRG